jgi:hypothetical protein
MTTELSGTGESEKVRSLQTAVLALDDLEGQDEIASKLPVMQREKVQYIITINVIHIY